MRKFRVLLAFFCGAFLVGCASPTTPRYTASATTSNLIQQRIKNPINIGEFTGPVDFDSSCRTAANLIIFDGLTHTQYIREAIKEEFFLAGKYITSASISLSGRIDVLEVSTIYGNWIIVGEIKSSNGKIFPLKKIYAFTPGAYWETACRNAADAYLYAIQDMIRETVALDEFLELLK